MLPQDRISSTVVIGYINVPESLVLDDLNDYELGGVALNDPSQGLDVQNWTLRYDQSRVIVKPEVGDETILFSRDSITALSLAFDQNMRPYVAYEAHGELYLWWWDSSINERVTTNFGAGKNPRLTLDDKRSNQSARSDIIFAYIDSNYNLCYRQQRDRFGIERVLKTGLHRRTRLKNVSMNTKLRLQFELV